MGWMVSIPELAGMFITRLSIFSSYRSISCYLNSLPVYPDLSCASLLGCHYFCSQLLHGAIGKKPLQHAMKVYPQT